MVTWEQPSRTQIQQVPGSYDLEPSYASDKNFDFTNPQFRARRVLSGGWAIPANRRTTWLRPFV